MHAGRGRWHCKCMTVLCIHAENIFTHRRSSSWLKYNTNAELSDMSLKYEAQSTSTESHSLCRRIYRCCSFTSIYQQLPEIGSFYREAKSHERTAWSTDIEEMVLCA
ncbi:hypothetical protein NPIL_112951 [Nephila pilipes]|uniref:Uncharacterized protein n=1 Tax=Nephila pilipes TaxID=299642 RepID=A0A8X6Q7R3_NEPPI|nr:hypothetical protein NPIL_112951 [Nephila pilipes]